MDTTTKKVRLATARSLASILLSVKAEAKQNDVLNDIDMRESKKKRMNPPADVEEDQADGRSSPVPGKSVTSPLFRLEFRELLRQLSSSYVRSHSRYVRSGLILSYTVVFKSLGSQFVNANYSTILEHLLNDIASYPLLGNDRYRALEARRHINYLLGHILRRQLLDEPAKMMAIRTIINTLEKKQRGKGNDMDVWSLDATVAAINELAGLQQDLGSAISLEQVHSLTVSGIAHDDRNRYNKYSSVSFGTHIVLSRQQPHGV